MNKWFLSELGVVTLFVVACGPNIRETKRTQTGGEIAMPHDGLEERAEAERIMAARCPGGFNIIEEGETKVGETASQNTFGQGGRGYWGGRTTFSSSQSTVRDNLEWRIRYECKAFGPANRGTSGAKEHEIFELRYRF